MRRSFYYKEDLSEIQRRIWYLYPFTVGAFVLLLFIIWFLQVMRGDYYKDLSENNSMRVVYLNPQRGLIYDRHGRIMSNNVPGFSLYLVPEDMREKGEVIKTLGKIISMEPSEIEMRLNAMHSQPSYLPVKIKGGLTMREVALLETHRLELAGIKITAESERNYPHGSIAAHLLGYVGEVSSIQLKERGFDNLIPSAIVGQYGMEKQYDPFLRGKMGKKVAEVDALGRETNTLRIDPPIPGTDIYLTIDLDLQKEAEEAFGDEAGALVAMDPGSGEILAMVSRPAFNPNLLSRGITRYEWEEISRDPGHLLINRAIQGEYPPGSTFKIVVASSALEAKDITPSFKVYCNGGLSSGRRIFKDWKKGGHGATDLHKGIVESCDVYFYELGRRVGIDRIAEFAKKYGLGEKTGIDLSYEKKGFVPTREWKEKAKGEPWFPGETFSLSIGQGYTTVTPLQMVNLVSNLISPDKRFPPHLIKGIGERGPGHTKGFTPEMLNRFDVSSEALALIRDALRGVVNEPHGTGARARSTLVEIAGKTGTAQVVEARHVENMDKAPKMLMDHAWFIAYAPAKDPKIAIAVLIEHGGHGGSVAAPIAKRIIERYLRADEGKDYRRL